MADRITILAEEDLTNEDMLDELDEALANTSTALGEAIDQLDTAHFYRKKLSQRLAK